MLSHTTNWLLWLIFWIMTKIVVKMIMTRNSTILPNPYSALSHYTKPVRFNLCKRMHLYFELLQKGKDNNDQQLGIPRQFSFLAGRYLRERGPRGSPWHPYLQLHNPIQPLFSSTTLHQAGTVQPLQKDALILWQRSCICIFSFLQWIKKETFWELLSTSCPRNAQLPNLFFYSYF